MASRTWSRPKASAGRDATRPGSAQQNSWDPTPGAALWQRAGRERCRPIEVGRADVERDLVLEALRCTLVSGKIVGGRRRKPFELARPSAEAPAWTVRGRVRWVRYGLTRAIVEMLPEAA
jgi:hypothetical protein